MKQLIAIVLFGSFLIFSPDVSAQFRGCHQWCGNEANKKWDEVIARLGKPQGVPQADREKDAEFRRCMAQTLAEGNRSDEDCNNNNRGQVPTPSGNPNRCESEYQDLAAQCNSAASAAVSSCDERSNSELADASSQASSQSSTSGVTDSCSGAQSVATTAKNAWTSYRQQCSSGMEQCLSACNALMTWANSNPSCFPLPSGVTKSQIASSIVTPKGDQCMDLQAKISSADSAISSYAKTASGGENCNNETAGGESKGSGINGDLVSQLGSVASSLLQSQPKTASNKAVTTFCAANPTYPGCGSQAIANCSDPTFAASNKVCQCAANPRSCVTVQSSGSSMDIASIDSSSRLPNSQAGGLDSGDIPDAPGIQMGEPPRGGDAEGIDGRQGGAPVGSSSVSAGGGPRGQANVNPTDDSAGQGSLGTFNGGGGSPRSFANGNYGRAQSARTGGSAGTTKGTPGTPDLRKFLPGGVYNPRPNMVGGRVGIDGITGPNSNIWKKVQNRYQVLKDTLHP